MYVAKCNPINKRKHNNDLIIANLFSNSLTNWLHYYAKKTFQWGQLSNNYTLYKQNCWFSGWLKQKTYFLWCFLHYFTLFTLICFGAFFEYETLHQICWILPKPMCTFSVLCLKFINCKMWKNPLHHVITNNIQNICLMIW